MGYNDGGYGGFGANAHSGSGKNSGANGISHNSGASGGDGFGDGRHHDSDGGYNGIRSGISRSKSNNSYGSGRNNDSYNDFESGKSLSKSRSNVSNAARDLRDTVKSLTGGKGSSLAGGEEDESGLLSKNINDIKDELHFSMDYALSPYNKDFTRGEFNKLFGSGVNDAVKSADRRFGIGVATDLMSPVAGEMAFNALSKFSPTAGALGAAAAQKTLSSLDRFADTYNPKVTSQAAQAVYDAGYNQAMKVAKDAGTGVIGNVLGGALDVVTGGLPIGTTINNAANHYLGREAVLDKYGDIGTVAQAEQNRQQAMKEAREAEAERRKIDGSNQGNYGILNQMTARLNTNTQPADKWQQFNATLPALNHLWDSITFKPTT
ncbi:hypothetical protein [Gallibacterium genomosp. 1]|uniref:hypothetical protein n=1 Tax=Gallibacterium genomosp. 1 TaxID=155515 RepID=UPI000802823C|nr:hypothetical protein [Gallibacterium genomosp. 1]OBX02198.1 hypothetical protein QV04_03955 [Gallibacterium genomosp. 1]